ncbi:hypothetical protein [Ulvibacterium marinum]|uniref:Uncharacterized protein n=1 Tax=Ulvibacterium marinum TaxID=2419782 RepID=A0A3B0C9K1_9FLAO|nr:hypothetical protein [Ulvibacterium marinum]RKN81651.1 hypothetical protein D7Z94_12160 [Ulvibacterium marinum]
MAAKRESWQRQIIIGVLVAIISAFIIRYLIPDEKTKDEEFNETQKTVEAPITIDEEEQLSDEEREMIEIRMSYKNQLDTLIKEGNALIKDDTHYFQLKHWQDEARPVLEQCERRFYVKEYIKFAHYCCNEYNAHGPRVERNTGENDQNLFQDDHEAGIYHIKNINALKSSRNMIKESIEEIKRGEVLDPQDFLN